MHKEHKEIDARGLACPAPVFQTEQAIEQQIIPSLEVKVEMAFFQKTLIEMGDKL